MSNSQIGRWQKAWVRARRGSRGSSLFRESRDYFHQGDVRLGATLGEVVKKGAGGTIGLVGAEGF